MGKKCYAVIADYLTLPIDEGLKKMSFELMRYASILENVDLYSSPEDIGINGVSLYKSNKLMFSKQIRKNLHNREYTDIFYIPEASTTFNSFIRAWFISLQTRNETMVHVINSQERALKKWQLQFIKQLKNIDVISFSHSANKKFQSLGIKTMELYNGVDTNVFQPVSFLIKQNLRKKYKLSPEKKIILHVGHIRKSRNISILKSLQEKGFQVVIVGSTSMAFERDLANELSECGIIILSDYNPHVEELYQLSDLYVFPVILSDAAIEFPLSVLEAMACGLPVLTTRFGALPDHFQESSCMGFFDTEAELIEKAIVFVGRNADSNRELVVKDFSWKNVFNKMFENS